MTNKKIPKILFFKLHKLSLLKHPKKEFIMAFNSGNNYVFEFITDSFWLAKKMAAAFDVGENTYYSPIIKGQCSVPDFVLKSPEFYLTVIGEDENGLRFKTNKNRIVQDVGG